MHFLLSQLQNYLRPNCGAKHAYLPIIRKVHRINAIIYERSTNLRILRSKFNSNIVLQLALLISFMAMAASISFASEPNPSIKEEKFSIVINAANKTDPRSPRIKLLLKQLYLKMKSEWPQGMKAEPIARPLDSNEQIAFTQVLLNMTEAELADYWLTLKQRTGQTQPRPVSSDTVLFKLLSKRKGAFSIVNQDVVESLPKNVVVLLTISSNDYAVMR